MVIDNQQKDKILAAYFASINLSEATAALETFVHRMHREGEYDQLKNWWDDMNALRVIRNAERLRNQPLEMNLPPKPIDNLSVGEGGVILLGDEQIGKVYNYYRAVLPQEIQMRLAYDTLIKRFIEFLQREKCAIRLSENDLTVTLFIPETDFQLADEWQQFVEFAYSENELYKSFTLFVNSMKLTDRGFGYVHFPSVTESMKLWQAAFYIATLEERVVRYPDNYRKAKTDEERKTARTENRAEFKQLLIELHNELRNGASPNETTRLFDKALKLSHRFNRTGATQFLLRNSETSRKERENRRQDH